MKFWLGLDCNWYGAVGSDFVLRVVVRLNYFLVGKVVIWGKFIWLLEFY